MRNKIIPYRPDLRAKARELRKHGTIAEALLWNEIKNKQLDVQFTGRCLCWITLLISSAMS